MMMTPLLTFNLKFETEKYANIPHFDEASSSSRERFYFSQEESHFQSRFKNLSNFKMSENNDVQSQASGCSSNSNYSFSTLFPPLQQLVPLTSCGQDLPLHNQDGYRAKSPFLHPSTAKPVTLTSTISTPNGTHMHVETKCVLRNESGATDAVESKSSLLGTYANLVNAIVGAGIVGIPYAMKETGLVAGSVLLIFVAILTDKTLRLLIETGNHCNVSSYEMLMEASFGRKGFVFISFNMFIMNFGAMICYLLIIKDNFSALIGLTQEDLWERRLVLIVSSFVIILPLSMQRVSKISFKKGGWGYTNSLTVMILSL